MLIHSSTSVSIDPSFLGSNNTILYDLSTDDLGPAQYITQNGFAGTFSSRGRWLVDIPNSGEIVIRIEDYPFENGSSGSQWTIATAPFTPFDSLNPSTVYSTDGLVSSPFTLGSSGTSIGHLGGYNNPPDDDVGGTSPNSSNFVQLGNNIDGEAGLDESGFQLLKLRWFDSCYWGSGMTEMEVIQVTCVYTSGMDHLGIN